MCLKRSILVECDKHACITESNEIYKSIPVEVVNEARVLVNALFASTVTTVTQVQLSTYTVTRTRNDSSRTANT